jgi:hypothetical protein
MLAWKHNLFGNDIDGLNSILPHARGNEKLIGRKKTRKMKPAREGLCRNMEKSAIWGLRATQVIIARALRRTVAIRIRSRSDPHSDFDQRQYTGSEAANSFRLLSSGF